MSSIKIWEDRERDLYAVLYCLDRPSANKKTGDMVQLAVLGLKHKPTFYIKNKAQHMCGSCALVSQCYVNPVDLNAIYDKTVHLDVELIPKLHKPIRLGSWGDPDYCLYRFYMASYIVLQGIQATRIFGKRLTQSIVNT